MKLIAIGRAMRRLATTPKRRTALRSPRSPVGARAGERLRIAAAAPGPAEFVEAKGLARRAAEEAMKRAAAARGMPGVAATERSNVCRFLAWAQIASADQRAEAARALARAYLCDGLPNRLRRDAQAGLIPALDDLRRDAEICLTTMVDDRSTLVRRALAEALAGADDAPRHIVCALASDQPDIAAVILARSPVLGDAELLEYAAIGGDRVQMALARRPGLSEAVAAALAAIDRREVVMALSENANAPLSPAAMRGIAERFGGDGAVRDALLGRPGLPAALRYDLFTAAARALSRLAGFETGEIRGDRMMRDALEQCAIVAAHACAPDEIGDLMRHLRATGALTAALLARALMSGGRGFFEAAAAELTGVAPQRVAGFVREPFGAGFAALYRRMGLPRQYLAPFRAALAALEECGGQDAGRILPPVVARAIAACESERDPALSGLLSLLRGLETQAALEEARALVEQAAAQRAAALPMQERACAAATVAIEPGLSSLLARLRRLEGEATRAEREIATAPLAEPRERIGCDGLAA